MNTPREVERWVVEYLTNSGTAENRMKDIADSLHCVCDHKEVEKAVERLLRRGVVAQYVMGYYQLRDT